MNTYTLESFISFCDDMMIAEEGKIFDRIKIKTKELIDKGNERYYKTHPNARPEFISHNLKKDKKPELTDNELNSLSYVHNLGKKAEVIITSFFKKYGGTPDRISATYEKDKFPVWIHDYGNDDESNDDETDEVIYSHLNELYDKLEKLEKSEIKNIKDNNIELAWFQSDGSFVFCIKFLKSTSNDTLESSVSFCDDMMISNESFNFKSILSKIQNVFSKLVLMIESKVKKMKDSKIKSVLLRLLSRAKSGLSKCKSLREYNPDMIDRLTQEAEEIKEEYEEVMKEDNTNNDNDDKKSNGDKIIYQADGKTIICIEKPDGTRTWYQDDGKTIESIDKPDGTGIKYRKDGKTIWYIEKPDGTRTWYYEDGKTIDYIKKPDGEETHYYGDSKNIMFIKKPDGTKITYKKDGKTILSIKKPDGTFIR